MTHALNALIASLVVSGASMWSAHPSWAQVDPGSRIRVTTAHGYHRGRLVSLDGDSLWYTQSDTTRVTALPLASVVRLERSVGKRSAAGRGALIGALIGGGFGLFLGIAASTDNSGWWQVGPEDVAAVTAVVGAAGAGIGGLIGAASKRDRWETVPLSPGVAENNGGILRHAVPTLR